MKLACLCCEEKRSMVAFVGIVYVDVSFGKVDAPSDAAWFDCRAHTARVVPSNKGDSRSFACVRLLHIANDC